MAVKAAKKKNIIDEWGPSTGPTLRRPLPEIDLSKCEDDPEWLDWKTGTPKIPDWYWVTRDGLWPQIVEFRIVGGKMLAIDKHSGGAWGESFWTKHAGPIPHPNPAGTLRYKNRGGR